MFAGAGIVYVAATLAAGAPDVLCLLGVMTYVTGMTGWCPLCEWLTFRRTEARKLENCSFSALHRIKLSLSFAARTFTLSLSPSQTRGRAAQPTLRSRVE